MNYEEMKIKLQSRLKPSRYEHSVGVAETAVFLAERFHVDVDKARIAGLLHGLPSTSIQLSSSLRRLRAEVLPLGQWKRKCLFCFMAM